MSPKSTRLTRGRCRVEKGLARISGAVNMAWGTSDHLGLRTTQKAFQ
jgi:hypothetical protein